MNARACQHAVFLAPTRMSCTAHLGHAPLRSARPGGEATHACASLDRHARLLKRSAPSFLLLFASRPSASRRALLQGARWGPRRACSRLRCRLCRALHAVQTVLSPTRRGVCAGPRTLSRARTSGAHGVPASLSPAARYAHVRLPVFCRATPKLTHANPFRARACATPNRRQMEALRALLAQLRAHASDAETVPRLCTELCIMLSADNALCAAAADSGALECVLELLQAHLSNAGVQAAGCAVLSSLSFIPANAHAAAGAGMIEALTAAMRTHVENGDVQRLACHALQNIMNSGVEYQVRAARAGGVEGLVAALRTHASSLSVQVFVMRAVHVLFQDGIAKLGSRAGGIEAVVAVMETHPQNACVQGSGCIALNNMVCCCGDAADIAVRAGACERCVAALSAHSEDEDVLDAACSALGSLSALPAGLARIHDAGGITIMLSLLRTRAAHEPTCGMVMFFFGNAAASGLRYADGVAAIHAALQTMRVHAASVKVQRYGCIALRNMCIADLKGGIRTAMVAAGAPEAMVAAIR
jgi:hypothetical protein